MNAERILIAAECIGDGRWFVDRPPAYATRARASSAARSAQNQGVQFPIARAYARLEAAALMRCRGRARCSTPGSPAAPRPTWPSCWPPRPPGRPPNACLQTHGGYGFAAEYDVERKFRETRLYQVAPVSTNLILAYVGEHVLGMPRSY